VLDRLGSCYGGARHAKADCGDGGHQKVFHIESPFSRWPASRGARPDGRVFFAITILLTCN
jgi:hypothetical protein